MYLAVPPLASMGQSDTHGIPAASPVRARRILVVDDHHDSADTMRELLALLGNDVQVAYDGPSAIEMFRRHLPSVVLLDVGLPGMSGLAVAERLRAQHGHAFRLVALTGHGRSEDRDATRAAGFDAHLVKPVRLDELVTLLGSSGEGA